MIEGEKNNDDRRKGESFSQHMLNAYREPDDRVDPDVVLQLNIGINWMEELAPMMMAMMSITDRMIGGLEEPYSDLVGFTHLLNRVAIQNSDFEDD